MSYGDQPINVSFVLARDSDDAYTIGRTIDESYTGLTKRDYYIGKVLAGLCANPDMVKKGTSHKKLAEAAIKQADAVVKLLEGVE